MSDQDTPKADPNAYTCPVCYVVVGSDMIIDHVAAHPAATWLRLYQWHLDLTVANNRAATQAATIRNMSADVERLQVALQISNAAEVAATREIATLRRTLENREATCKAAKDARRIAENESEQMYEALQKAGARATQLEEDCKAAQHTIAQLSAATARQNAQISDAQRMVANLAAERDQALDTAKSDAYWRNVEKQRVAECHQAIRALQDEAAMLRRAVGRVEADRDKALDDWATEAADLRNKLDKAQDRVRELQQDNSDLRLLLSDLRPDPEQDDDPIFCPLCPGRYTAFDGLHSHLRNTHNTADILSAMIATMSRNRGLNQQLHKQVGLIKEYRHNLDVLNGAYHDRASAAQTAERDLIYARKQLAQVLELVAGARLAVNKALAVGEVDAAHLAGLNGYDRTPTPVGIWADDPALYTSVGDMADYVTAYQNAHRDPLAVAYAAAAPNGVADDTAASESTPAGAEPILPPGWSLAPDGQLTTRSTLVERTVKCGECGGEFLKIAFPLDEAALPSVFCGTCRHHVATLAPEHVSSTGGPCYLLDMAAGTLYPPATRDTVNPLSAVACPACKNRELKIFINEHEQGYVSCAECSQLIGNLFEHSNARRYV